MRNENRSPIVALATSNDGKSFAWEYFTQTNISSKNPMALCAIPCAFIHLSTSNDG